MATRKKKKIADDGLDGWAIGVLQWNDPTLFSDSISEEDAANVIVSDSIATKFTFGFWRRDSNGDYLVYSELCLVDGELQFDQSTIIPKALVQKAVDFRERE